MPTLALQAMNYMYCAYTCPSLNTTNGVLHCTLSQRTAQVPMGSAPSLQADSILNSPTLQVWLVSKGATSCQTPQGHWGPQNNHAGGNSQCDWYWHPHNIMGAMNWSPPPPPPAIHGTIRGLICSISHYLSFTACFITSHITTSAPYQ